MTIGLFTMKIFILTFDDNATMKKYIFILLGVLLSACSAQYAGNDYPTGEDSIKYEVTTDTIAVLTAMNEPFFISLTRGYGAFDTAAVWKNDSATFYIYAFLANNSEYTGDIDYSSDVTDDEESNITQCLVGDKSSGLGAAARLGDDGLLYFLHGKQFVYSLTHQAYRYNFFAYYTDDAVTGTVRREKKGITLPLTINGTQDIVCSIAHPTDEQKKQLQNQTATQWIASELDNYAYSTLTGHRSILPVFNARHCLSRFLFTLTGEDKLSDSIYIQDIYVKSKVNGNFVVAANDTTQVGLTFPASLNTSLSTLHMAHRFLPGVSLDVTKCTFPAYYYHVKKNEKIKVGEGFLLPAGEEYELFIDCAQRLENGTLRTYTAHYTLQLNGDNQFEAGKQYTVDISVYGYQTVKLGLQIGEWINGEDVTLNNEDDILYEE